MTVIKKKAGPYQLFMLILCAYVLLALAAGAFLPMDSSSREVLEYVDTGICVLFLIDFMYSLAIAHNRQRYFFTWGWIDLLSSIPAVGPFRWGRAVRLVRILRLIRGVRSAREMTDYLLARRAESALIPSKPTSISVAANRPNNPLGGSFHEDII